MGTLDDGLKREWRRLTVENARLEAENSRLRAAAGRVCWFDWSTDNDPDAVAAVDELRRALEQQEGPQE